MQIYSPTLGGTRFLMFFIDDKREERTSTHLLVQRVRIFFQQLRSWIHGSAVATSISIPRSAAAAEGRDPRSTAAEGSDRPKAAINGGRRPASGPSTLPPQRLQLQSQPIPFPHFGPVFLGHRSSSHFRALLSAAPSPETLIPPLSLPLPRLPSHVHSDTC